jgi:hypothetical protein
LLALAAAWKVLSHDAAEADLAVAAAFGLLGLAGGRWLSERDDRAAQEERIVTLGSVFYQSPQVLRSLLQPARIDEFLRNLLKTVLKDDELGESVWAQGVSPLVHAIDSGECRYRMRYNVRLAAMSSSGSPSPIQTLSGDPEQYFLLTTELSYSRPISALPKSLSLGLIFEPGRGLSWFDQAKFALREYSPLTDTDVVNLFGSHAVRNRNGRFYENLKRPRIPGGSKRELLTTAQALFCPSLEVGQDNLEPKRARMNWVGEKPTGIAVEFHLPRSISRSQNSTTEVELRARLSIPIPRTVASFPVHLSELTRGAEIVFDYAQVAIEHVDTDMFFAGQQPFRENLVRSRPGYLVVSTSPDEWLFKGSGVVFSWQPPNPQADQISNGKN